MKTYRHLNFLIDSSIYGALRKESRKLEKPISVIAREALASYLKVDCPKVSEGEIIDNQHKA
ncbi:MAG: hypothetical protein DYG83_18305 [Candidatus Brocadia sp. AMX2]|uniref:Ribbon-helix-helix protein CopG domain-containing protein n=1 Tax=Candidatus Brocadia sinica JPN1 TaxID=1197129 RepID=A0ABQ0JZI8_9BACT|nr:MAG: hypothetical protein EDM70_18805 [Candidatus Brocadia sp. AMX2]MBC6934184.1 hypothetical protein [Candidatus Brocadia sp.]MBL1170464.1 hypothetical protein [Candidatus Brocadia sp. AMX1]GAN34111.1 hypothetical protein BROSI_A2647 [Candidatus Brocadia sinica JPN1]GIK14376.1 MAG: hypothetical protein BroJett002_30830 [Candidatus Brocadia sinica]